MLDGLYVLCSWLFNEDGYIKDINTELYIVCCENYFCDIQEF